MTRDILVTVLGGVLVAAVIAVVPQLRRGATRILGRLVVLLSRWVPTTSATGIPTQTLRIVLNFAEWTDIPDDALALNGSKRYSLKYSCWLTNTTSRPVAVPAALLEVRGTSARATVDLWERPPTGQKARPQDVPLHRMIGADCSFFVAEVPGGRANESIVADVTLIDQFGNPHRCKGVVFEFNAYQDGSTRPIRSGDV